VAAYSRALPPAELCDQYVIVPKNALIWINGRTAGRPAPLARALAPALLLPQQAPQLDDVHPQCAVPRAWD
jgi:hypothetical protein